MNVNVCYLLQRLLLPTDPLFISVLSFALSFLSYSTRLI
jgi:hypothetical protein